MCGGQALPVIIILKDVGGDPPRDLLVVGMSWRGDKAGLLRPARAARILRIYHRTRARVQTYDARLPDSNGK